MATEAPQPGPAEDAPGLPEKIGPADLEALNQALAALFQELRFAESPTRRDAWATERRRRS
jgi:hypothetical protein